MKDILVTVVFLVMVMAPPILAMNIFQKNRF
jgi:hypothetical protein